jgi:hypothetical protein
MKSSFTKLFILFFILIVVGILYKRFEDKRLKDEYTENNNVIQKYLLDEVTLAESKKPILWIYVPYEYNSRKWLSFGSRSSFDLNQPYLYLTVKSIINKCSNSFTICLIDDNAFSKVIPGWNIDMSSVSSPIVDNIRMLGLMKLIYIYGGLICPISFVCMKDLNELYIKGTAGGKLFLCETNNRNITSTTNNFYPNLTFCGAPKENHTVANLIDFMQRITSNDYTADVKFLGDFDRWCNKRIETGEINLIDGKDICIKTTDNTHILLEDLMSNNYLKIYPQPFGILIPADELLKRRKYQWFTRMSTKQVLESDVIIGNYLLLYNTPNEEEGIIEPLQVKPDWVAFWKTPLYNGLYGLKPLWLGDNQLKVKYPGR